MAEVGFFDLTSRAIYHLAPYAAALATATAGLALTIASARRSTGRVSIIAGTVLTAAGFSLMAWLVAISR